MTIRILDTSGSLSLEFKYGFIYLKKNLKYSTLALTRVQVIKLINNDDLGVYF
jgi:hypothetical protein